jgi:glycosyltransferase involved in cell wall biosynthesis
MISAMRTLVVSQFYPPEPGAAQNRLGAFVEGLLDRGHAVTVLCEQPNHPAGRFQPGYGRRPVVVERDGPLTVKRLWVAASPRKTVPRRAAFYGTFAAGAAAIVLGGPRFDVALASSPPLPGALAATAAARARRIPFVLDVRDIWTIAVGSLDMGGKAGLLHPLETLERLLFRSAGRVTTTTHAFCRHIDQVAGRQVSEYLPNGARDDLLALPERAIAADGALIVGYAGNLGLLHGLEVVLDAADLLRSEDVRFVIVGDGPRGDDLRRRRQRLGLESVEMRPSIPAERIGEFLMGCDVLLSPLAPHPALDAVIPSKTYDAMAVGRPVITSARGEAAALVRDNDCGMVVEPNNPAALAEAIRVLARDRELAERYGRAGRATAAAHARSGQLELLDGLLRGVAGAAPRG